ncbi:hypothetical protein [Haloarchaeobius sp. DFWS5]|uniref:hypothetical protein n=1 Tax=Haloarchaeobius sp. DFWS5 TaxID=3446114 RepID=UPI003EB7874D
MHPFEREYTLPVVLAVGVVLLAASAVFDSPATDAAPTLFGGLVVLGFAAWLLQFGTALRTLFAAGVALLIGGVLLLYDGLATLTVVPAFAGLGLVGDLALLVGFGLFIYDRRVA